MTEDEGEIEYLEEDEDLVQQYVVNTVPNVPTASASTEPILEVPVSKFIPEEPLLVERKPAEKRKLQRDEDDSDYDPSEDLKYLEEERKKRRLASNRKVIPKIINTPVRHIITRPIRTTPPSNPPKTTNEYENKLKNLPNLTVKKTLPTKFEYIAVKPEKPARIPVRKTPAELLKERKKLEIKIPDYHDALCLPAMASMNTEPGDTKLRDWNKQCLEQYKKNSLEDDKTSSKVVSSVRTIMFRNVKKKSTGKVETSIWGKNAYQLEDGEKTINMFQSILPKFRDKTVIKPYTLTMSRGVKNITQTNEALLTLEKWKDEMSLVVYKPQEFLSSVYKFNRDSIENEGEMRVLRETTCTKMCAPCYQASWRGVRNTQDTQKIRCNICTRSFVSLSTLLNHLKLNHTAQEVRRCKAMLSKTVAKIVGYHYKCRICQEMFLSIKLLRKHVLLEHKGKELFTCEVGNHMAS